jgi:hypothetical protein
MLFAKIETAMIPQPITLKEACSRTRREMRNSFTSATTVVIGVTAKNQQKNASVTRG